MVSQSNLKHPQPESAPRPSFLDRDLNRYPACHLLASSSSAYSRDQAPMGHWERRNHAHCRQSRGRATGHQPTGIPRCWWHLNAEAHSKRSLSRSGVHHRSKRCRAQEHPRSPTRPLAPHTVRKRASSWQITVKVVDESSELGNRSVDSDRGVIHCCPHVRIIGRRC